MHVILIHFLSLSGMKFKRKFGKHLHFLKAKLVLSFLPASINFDVPFLIDILIF